MNSKQFNTIKKRKVIFDQDGGLDDILGLILMMSMENIEVIGSCVTAGVCFMDCGVESTLKLFSLFGKDDCEVSKSRFHGQYQFPREWRAYSNIMNSFPLMIDQPFNQKALVSEPADEFLIRKLKESKEPITIMLTGPCSNLAAALEKAPEIKEKIEEVVIMGGAVDTKGNVEYFGHDGTAEWNFFWDPVPAKKVITSGLKITLFSLDATDKTPVKKEFLKRLARQRKYHLSDLTLQGLAITMKNLSSYAETFYLWDVLAVAYLGCDGMITTRKVELDVSVQTPNEGQTIKCPGNNCWVDVADEVNVEAFEEFYVKQLQKDFPKAVV